MLEELRQGPFSPPSQQSVVRQVKDDLRTAEWESFHDALRLYATIREIDSYNLPHLESLNRPVINVKAFNTGPAAKQAAQDEETKMATLRMNYYCQWELRSCCCGISALMKGWPMGRGSRCTQSFGTTSSRRLQYHAGDGCC